MTNNNPKAKQDATFTSSSETPAAMKDSAHSVPTKMEGRQTKTTTKVKQRNSLKKGQRVYHVDGEGESQTARIKEIDHKMHTYTIEVNGREVPNLHHDDLSVVHPTVDKILGILKLRDETDNYLREKYPTLEEFENFLKLSFEVVQAKYKQNGSSKEPRFKRSDREEFIILSRWTEVNQDGGGNDWQAFNQKNFNNFREQALKDDLIKILKELGIDNDRVKNALEAKSVRTAADFAQKPKSWYEKLCEEESGTEESSQQTRHPLLNGAAKYAIEKFKDWYNFHFIGYLPSDWIVSFRNDDVHPKERDLRKVLRVIGLKADAIEALKMNDILDIATLNRTSAEWKTQDQRRGRCCGLFREQRDEERASQWEDMGLTRNDASDIISFRHWYNFYVAGKKNMKGWTAEFNSAQYNNFLLLYQPGDDFKKPSWCCCCADSLNFSQERHDYIDMLQEIAERGEVTEELRYHVLEYMKKREEMVLIEEIISHHYKGLGDSALQEDRLRELFDRDEQEADKKEKEDLLSSQKFYQFFFSAFLVSVLLVSLGLTTVYFMIQYSRGGKEPGFEPHPGFDYVTFTHNVLFGLVTAVVIQELGEEAKETSLYWRFLPIYREQRKRQRDYRILAKGWWSCIVQFIKTSLMKIILWSTRFYIFVWTCLGTASLIFGAVEGLDTSNPLYTTGQTWLGIAVTIGYTYFGLSAKKAPKPEDAVGKTKAPKLEDANEQIDHRNKDDDGSDDANGREEAPKKKQVPKATSAAPSSGTKVATATGNTTATSTSEKKQAAGVTPDPPSFKGMQSLGNYKDEDGTTFEKYQATPDGNCLPYAVNGSNDYQTMIQTRHGAAQYVELHRSHYDSVFDDTEEVIAQFRNVGTPLGHEFLQVLADWTGDTIVLYVTGRRTPHTFTPSAEFESASPSGETRFVIYNNVNHHDGLRLIDNSSKEKADEDSGKEDDEDGDGDGDDLSKEEEKGFSGDDVEGEDEGNSSKSEDDDEDTS